jgi:NRPS condensation-like uncharacterized protein
MSDDRKLGAVEEAMELLNQQANTWNVVTISRIKSSLQSPLKEDILRQAIQRAQQRHPRLRSQIIDSLNCPHFKTNENLKVPLRIIWKRSWQEVVQEELNIKIDVENSLLRVVLVYDFYEPDIAYLITTIHHAISDALSCVQLHAEILGYCAEAVSGKPRNSVASLSPLPPVEELLPSWAKGLKGTIKRAHLLTRLGFQEIWQRPETLGFEEDVPLSKRRCGLIHRRINEQLSRKFVNRCREENTTVHGALCAALMFTVARQVTAGKERKVHLSCQSYLDLRKQLSYFIKDDQMAVLASAIRTAHTISSHTSFWELAREVKHRLNHIKQSDIFSALLMTKSFMKLFLARPQQVLASVSVSNIGRVSIPETYGPFEIEEISFLGSNSLFGGILAVNISSFRERMFLNFSFSEPSLSRETMETLVECILGYLREVCEESALS